MAANAFYNTAYVEVNSSAFSNVGCYVLSGTHKPFFDYASIFAANINTKTNNPNEPTIFFNPQVTHVLDQTDDVKNLQGQGIKVLLTLLGNHQNVGWSCITQPQAAKKFADSIADVVVKYNLDGVDIDDEYSACTPNDQSMIMIAQALKSNPKFKGKALTKALFSDSSNFTASYQGHKLADYLDQGWEMSYGSGGPYRLEPYVDYGMSKNNLALGVWTNGYAGSAARSIGETMQQGYGGAMVYDVKKSSQSYLTAIAQKEYQQSVDVLPRCLK